MEPSDQQLVQAALSGELRSFEILVERHRDVVLRVAARIAGDDDAEDAAQDAFLRAYHRLARWRGDGEFRTWLLRIAHNAALDHVSARRPPAVQIDDIEGEPAEVPERTPAARLEAAERRARLDLKLKALAPPHRTVLVLRDIEGFSYNEIAEV